MTEHEPFDWKTGRRSTSQRRMYRRCGYAYLHKYVHGWKETTRRGTYAFGDTMQMLADAIVLRLITTPERAEEVFVSKWSEYADDATLTWTSRAPWGTLKARGAALAKVMVAELPKVLGKPSVEHLNENILYRCGGIEELAIPDFYGPIAAETGVGTEMGLACGMGPFPFRSVIDFKTSDRRYVETAAEIDEQLTDYQLAEQALERPVDVVGLCVLVYTVKPEIQWLLAPARPQDELDRFISTAQIVDAQIRSEVFIRDDRACHSMGECPFLPLCYESQRKRAATELRQTQPTNEPTDEEL